MKENPILVLFPRKARRGSYYATRRPNGVTHVDCGIVRRSVCLSVCLCDDNDGSSAVSRLSVRITVGKVLHVAISGAIAFRSSCRPLNTAPSACTRISLSLVPARCPVPRVRPSVRQSLADLFPRIESIYTRRRWRRGTWLTVPAGYYTLDGCRNLFTESAVNAALLVMKRRHIRPQTLQHTIQTNQPASGLAALLGCDHLGTGLEVQSETG